MTKKEKELEDVALEIYNFLNQKDLTTNEIFYVLSIVHTLAFRDELLSSKELKGHA